MATPKAIAKDFTGSETAHETEPLLRLQVPSLPAESARSSDASDEHVSGSYRPVPEPKRSKNYGDLQNESRSRMPSTTPSGDAASYSIQETDNNTDNTGLHVPLRQGVLPVEQLPPLPPPPSIFKQLVQEVKDHCKCFKKWKPLRWGVPVFVLLVLLFIVFIVFGPGLIHNQRNDREVYSGDTILLVNNLDPFWYGEAVVDEVTNVKSQQEVRFIKEKCKNLITYTTDTAFQSPTLNASSPVAILDHQRSFNNYFISGSVSVTVTATISPGSESKLYLCWFDNYNLYNQFRTNPTPNIRQQAWQPCTEFCTDFRQPVSRTVSNVITQPGYYYIGVAQTSPVTLQYAFNLSQEVYNHSDYTTLNCSVTGSVKCSIPLDPVYLIDSTQEVCILAFDPLLPNEIVGYRHLEVSLKSRVFNTVSISFGVILIFAIVTTVFLCIVAFRRGLRRNN